MSLPTAPRKVTRVAVGVLVRDDGAVLLADRPVGKPYAGYWEFPGGKIEPDEQVAAALERELHEELGIEIGPSAPWVTFEHDYPHAYVRLYFRRVRRWNGEPHAREGQRLQFAHPAGKLPQPLLPAAVPAMRWLRLPQTAVLVSSRSELPSAPGSGLAADTAPRLIVIDTDWRTVPRSQVISAWRNAACRAGDQLLAAGPGAVLVEGVDGVVFESVRSVEASSPRSGDWCGAWVDSIDESASAARSGVDFVLLRQARVSETAHEKAAVPVFFAASPRPTTAGSATDVATECWVDLRIGPTQFDVLRGQSAPSPGPAVPLDQTRPRHGKTRL